MIDTRLGRRLGDCPRWTVCLLCAALLSGCAAIEDFIAAAVLPPQQAAALGSRLAQEIESKRGLHPSHALQRRVADIGRRIVAAAGPVSEAYDFSFKVIEEPQTLNAFALPGGPIYVTSGLVEAAGSDAQLASVLAHEVAHVTERHVADRLATSYGVQLLGAAALGENPGAIAQIAGSLLQQGLVLKYSRSQELQADRVGLGYLGDAGYDRQAALAMFRKLAPGGESQAPVFLSSHPAMSERIERLQSIIARRD